MQRLYTREQYLERISFIKASKRDISLTSDIIVGFPGETEADFEETLSLLDLAQYDGVFSFQYSPRPNTPARTMPGAIAEEEKSRRLRILQERQRVIQEARNQALIGTVLDVFVEGAARHENQWMGRTSSNRTVNITSPCESLLGEYVNVRITGAGPNSLAGEHLISA
jgi:tRNA-2-methylthio-N6-dimethylallyladenosine synthase